MILIQQILSLPFLIPDFVIPDYKELLEQANDGSVSTSETKPLAGFRASQYAVRPVPGAAKRVVSAKTLHEVWFEGLKLLRTMKLNWNTSGNNGSVPLWKFVPTNRWDIYWVRLHLIYSKRFNPFDTVTLLILVSHFSHYSDQRHDFFS